VSEEHEANGAKRTQKNEKKSRGKQRPITDEGERKESTQQLHAVTLIITAAFKGLDRWGKGLENNLWQSASKKQCSILFSAPGK